MGARSHSKCGTRAALSWDIRKPIKSCHSEHPASLPGAKTPSITLTFLPIQLFGHRHTPVVWGGSRGRAVIPTSY